MTLKILEIIPTHNKSWPCIQTLDDDLFPNSMLNRRRPFPPASCFSWNKSQDRLIISLGDTDKNENDNNNYCKDCYLSTGDKSLHNKLLSRTWSLSCPTFDKSVHQLINEEIVNYILTAFWARKLLSKCFSHLLCFFWIISTLWATTIKQHKQWNITQGQDLLSLS